MKLRRIFFNYSEDARPQHALRAVVAECFDDGNSPGGSRTKKYEKKRELIVFANNFRSDA